MPSAAPKCVTCESYQGWRRHISMSTTMVALLTALVSVLSIAVPPMLRALQPDNSKISVAFGGDDEEGAFYLLAINVGNRPGTLAEVSIDVPMRGKKFNYKAALDTKVSDASVFPNAPKRVRLMLDVGQDLDAFTSTDVAGPCTIVVNVLEFNSVGKPTSFSVPCKDLRPLGLRNAP